MNNAWKITGAFAIYSLSTLLMSQQASALPNQASKSLLAQADNCRLINVDAGSSLNVRQQPQGAVLQSLEAGERVSIVGEPVNGWIAIQSPVSGYVAARYLRYCSNSAASITQTPASNAVANATTNVSQSEQVETVAGSSCRRVTDDNIAVKTRPDGSTVWQLSRNEQVYIANEGRDGWVPIERPVNGYIPAQYLTQCSQETADLSQFVDSVSGTNCRAIMSPDVQVRAKPMGNVIGQLNQNEQVYIANEGYNGWVPIEKPVSGYVTSAHLGDCK